MELDQIKGIEMEETCRIHGTGDEYLKFSEVNVEVMPCIASSFLRL